MNERLFNRRLLISGAIVFCAALFLVARLFTLHFSSKISIEDKKSSELSRRGYIKDRNGNILAMSIELNSLFANPEEIEDTEDVSKKLSLILETPADIIAPKLIRGGRFSWIARMISDSKASEIRALGIRGLYFKKEFKRVYPNNRLAANIIGFVGRDGNGLEGVEYKFDDMLKGVFNITSDSDRKYSYGNNITLTIDRNIQHEAEKVIEKTVSAYEARQGVILVTETGSGRILAMAKYPLFDPNIFASYTPEERRNFTVVDAFEPGSTMKIFSAIAWLNSKVNRNEVYRCEGGIQIADAHIRCTDKHGYVDMNESIKKSCNVGIIMSMKNVESSTLYAILRKFSFGEKLGTDFPGESSGILREVKEWSGLSKYSIAIGQEISVTSLQLVAAYSAIGNNGIYYVPSLIESVAREDGKVIQSFYPLSRGRVLTVETCKILKKMLLSVVSDGTGKGAALADYAAAGKTGTAQKSTGRGGYLPGENVVSFVGFAPVDNPDVTIAVIVDSPKAGGGGLIAAPAFRDVAKRILPYRGITEKSLPYVKPKRYVSDLKFDGSTLPDFTGRSFADVLPILNEMRELRGVKYTIEGEGVISEQIPLPNSKVENYMEIKLILR